MSEDEKNSFGEKGGIEDYVVRSEGAYQMDVSENDHVQRKLKERHVQMIAIAGTIGTGLFLGSGHALSGAGPLGALVAYALVGTVAYSALCSLGEMTAHAPVSGSFPHFAARWVDPAFGFALGWNYWYTNAISVPVEITAATILVTFWDSNLKHQAGYTALFCVLVCLINIFGVRYFGESEFFFSIIKRKRTFQYNLASAQANLENYLVLLITGLILTGLIIDLGGGPDHDRRGFRYWKNPGAVAPAGLVLNNLGLDKFVAILNQIVQAGFSFQGMELVAIAASETQNPRRNISKAVRRVFWRVLIFYILGILVTGMLVPYTDPRLLSNSGTAAQSPYVIVMTSAGIKVLPHIVNACVLLSAFSAGNSFLFAASRVLYGLALRGQAPKFLGWCTKQGLPLAAVLFTSALAWLAFMNVSSSSTQVFNWFVNLSTIGGFFGWWGVNVTYIFFYQGFKAQGRDRKDLAYYNFLQPWLSYWGVFWTTVFILINGFTVFWDFNASGFLVAYLNIPLFFALYFGWKIIKRTKIWKPSEMDFVTGIPTIEETDMPIEPPRNILEKIAAFVF
ncbi:hypothetical protein EUX98_g5823 [Antrodiella citrinella]|uniref:Amino acid permease/ SLC12A domain-containing protein n=1 Tax=Antrodiella citrinella TaxID=2447956 RepID=A0A4S4MT52_9APHY|nr:hypothetical protein EUX98_g5823 [Antrodiella citrinella]